MIEMFANSCLERIPSKKVRMDRKAQAQERERKNERMDVTEAGQLDRTPKVMGLKSSLLSEAPEKRTTLLDTPLPVNSFHVGDS